MTDSVFIWNKGESDSSNFFYDIFFILKFIIKIKGLLLIKEDYERSLLFILNSKFFDNQISTSIKINIGTNKSIVSFWLNKLSLGDSILIMKNLTFMSGVGPVTFYFIFFYFFSKALSFYDNHLITLIKKCYFLNLTSPQAGGAIFFSLGQKNVFLDSIFFLNKAQYGGAVFFNETSIFLKKNVISF